VAAPDAASPRGPAGPASDTPSGKKDNKKGDTSKLELASADGANKLTLSGIVHADARLFFADSGVTTFAVRRARPALDAKVFEYFEFRVQPDFAGSRAELLDAYGNIHFVDELQLLVGKAKGPIGLERLQSPRDITFAERGYPTLLVPNRDVGAKLHGKLIDGAIEWAVGAYNGVPNGRSGDIDTNDAKDVEGRLFVLPFPALGVDSVTLGLGVAGAVGDQQAPFSPYVTSGQQPFFSYAAAATAFGRRTVISPQGYFYAGPVGVLSEFVRVREHVVSTTGATGTVGSQAFQIAGTVVIGGKPSYKGVKVNEPVDPENGTSGAFELKARYHSLRVGDLAYARGFANRSSAAAVARAFTVGGTWHLAQGHRALVDYERTTFRGGAANQGNRKFESVLVTRLQAAF
jgi:phosphate-selective porin OprO/OprP